MPASRGIGSASRASQGNAAPDGTIGVSETSPGGSPASNSVEPSPPTTVIWLSTGLPAPSIATPKPERPGARIVEVFRRATDLLSPAEQKPAFAAYVKHHGGKLHEEAKQLRAEWKNETLTAKVDTDGTVYSLDAG